LLDAALINGAASHALDFDDTHTLMSGHPSAPVVPAALALAERDDIDGSRFLAALIAGVETECRAGALVNPGHYAMGFHATGTLGTFGAAAACAQLLALDAPAWEQALALAGTQAAGVKSAFGTMAKPLHAGRAASNGLLAALLAGGGFTGAADIIGTEQGFASTHGGFVSAGDDADHAFASAREAASMRSPTPDPRRLERYRERFLIRDTLFKYHASCYLTHAAIDAAKAARANGGFSTDDVESVDVLGSRGCVGVCDIAEPMTGLEGKFSVRATTAMALLGDDTSDPAAFSDARMRAPEFRAMLDRVTFTAVDGVPATQARVVVRAAGRVFEAESDSGVPAKDVGRQWDALSAKFFALSTPVIGADEARRLHSAVGQIEEVRSVREITSMLSPTPAAGR
jgi:2-methylcitrate dehydratase PrpD